MHFLCPASSSSSNSTKSSALDLGCCLLACLWTTKTSNRMGFGLHQQHEHNLRATSQIVDFFFSYFIIFYFQIPFLFNSIQQNHNQIPAKRYGRLLWLFYPITVAGSIAKSIAAATKSKPLDFNVFCISRNMLFFCFNFLWPITGNPIS